MSYHYKYASGREGNALLVSFSPRKAKISLYLTYESEEREKLLESFGKHTKSKACIYVNTLADIDIDVLKDLIKHTVKTYQNLFRTNKVLPLSKSNSIWRKHCF